MQPVLAALDVGAMLSEFRDQLLVWLPVALLVALIYVMWRAVSMMPRTTLPKIAPDESGDVRWDHIAGLDEAREELMEVVEFLRDPARFERVGARCPKGVLLYGPPGTGKTLLARAVARESGAAFFAASGASFVEMFSGLGASRVRRLFKSARKHAPAIVFIDELDAVGSIRTQMSSNREGEQTLNQLLVELDGFSAQTRVVVIGASNRLDALDPALLRPGRFDRRIYVGTPDLAGRTAILGVHVKDKPLAPDVDLEALARQTAGLAGAELENIANEAAIQAARAGRATILRTDFDWALERVIAGLRTSHLISEREKAVVAYHEAGHALVAHLLGRADGIQKVTIVPRGATLGFVLSLPDEDRMLMTQEELLDEIAVLLGGRAAEEVIFGRVTTGASADLSRVSKLAKAMVCDYGMGATTRSRAIADGSIADATREQRDREQEAIADACHVRALDLVREHRDALERLAAALLSRETLERDDVRLLLAEVAVESDAAALIGSPVLWPSVGRRARMLPPDITR